MKKKQGKSFKNLLKNNVVSVVVLVLLISVVGVFAGNVFVTDGDVDVDENLNVSGNLTTTGTGTFGNLIAGSVTPSHRFAIGSTDNSDKIEIYHDNNDMWFKTTDGLMIFQNTEGSNTNLQVRGSGGYGNIVIMDQDNAEWLYHYMTNGIGVIRTAGTSPQQLSFQDTAHADVHMFRWATSGETRELWIGGYRAGDSLRQLQIGVGVDANDTASFDGVSNYYFDGKLGVQTSSPLYPLEIGVDVSGISIYSQANVSATGYITRTSVFDKSQGNALDFIKDADDYLIEGEIDHSKFYGYAGEFEVTDYSRPVTVQETEIINNCIKEVEGICEEYDSYTITEDKTTYPYKTTTGGILIDAEIDVLRQAVYELKTELCAYNDKYSWC